MNEADIYADARSRFLAVITSVSDDVLGRRLSPCPLWTPLMVVAHLIGASEDFLAGHFPAPPTTFEEWTAAQVARRKDRSLADMLGDWPPIASRVIDGIRGGNLPPVPLINDTATHEQDVRGLARMPGGTDSPGYQFSRSVFMDRLGARIDEAGLLPLSITTERWSQCVGSGGGSPQLVNAPAYDFERATVGRRSANQMRAFQWSSDPEPYISLMPAFRMPDHDIVETAPGLSDG